MKCTNYEAHYGTSSILVISSFLGENTLLSILFSDTLNLCSSFMMRNEVSHPYKIARKITVLFNLILCCSVQIVMIKVPELNGSKYL